VALPTEDGGCVGGETGSEEKESGMIDLEVMRTLTAKCDERNTPGHIKSFCIWCGLDRARTDERVLEDYRRMEEHQQRADDLKKLEAWNALSA
jgi:hypothetical protein